MTSATVTDFSIQALAGMTAPGQNRNGSTANFADFMQSGTRAENVAKTQPVKGHDAKAAYEKTENKAAGDITGKAEKTHQGSAPGEAKMHGKAEEAEKNCLQKIAKELGVSQEDVEQALEILGLTVADLLQQGNMNLLIAQVTGSSPMEIVTDAGLFSRMEMLVDQVSQKLMQAAQELGMEFDEFVAAIEEALTQPAEAQMAELQQTGDAWEMPGTEIAAGLENVEMEASAALKEQSEETATVSDEGVAVEIDNRDAVSGERTQADSFTQQDDKRQQKDEPAGFDAQGERTGMTPELRGVQNLPQDVLQPEPAFERFDMEQTRRIIDQIADYVKIHQGQQVTELEMQLNPASLGTIHLQVASKAGTVSAQLIAQDQAVAAALESQLMLVKESLEAQGMKVDAVEVTVASHEFEQNLDRQGKQQEDEAKRTAGRSRRRILDLNDLPAGDELPAEEMTEADRLQIEMMRMGGNRLNFRI